MRSPSLRALAVLMLLLAGTGSSGQQPTLPVKGGGDSEAERADDLAYAELDRVLLEREEAIARAVRGLHRFIVFRYRDAVLARTIPVLAALRAEAGAAAREGRTRDAAARYQAALVVSQLAMMDVNLVIIADYADQSKEPSGEIIRVLNAYESSMRPLLEAAASLDPEQLKAALPEGTRRYSEWVGFANEWTKAIGRGAEISRKMILVLDTAMVVLAVRQLAVMAARGVSGGGPPMMPMPSGVMAATRLDVAAMERTYEAIRRLIAAGAMDPVVAGGIAAFAHAAANPELTGPVAWSMQGVDPPPALPATPPSPKEPGQWSQTKESMSDRAAEYQEQQTGRPARVWEYKVGDVSFDGFKDGKLIEAKGPGYAQWLELDGTGTVRFRKYFEGARQMTVQLKKHGDIAERGIAVEWRVAEPRLAEYLRQYIENRGFKITVSTYRQSESMAPIYSDIGIYWGRRREGVRACAERFARWLHELGEIEPLFATWCQLGWSRRDALKKKVIPTAEHIEQLLAASPIFSESRPQWSESFWTPGPGKWGDAKVEVFCGDYDPHALNTAHLELPQTGPAAERIATREVMFSLFECTVRAWEPHDGFIRSFQYWKTLPPRGPGVIWGGWMIYFSREAGRIPPLPAPAEIIPVDDLGHIIVFTPEPFREDDPEHVAWANRLCELLSKAGLKMATRD